MGKSEGCPLAHSCYTNYCNYFMSLLVEPWTQLRECKVEAERLVESTKTDLIEAFEEMRKASAECEAERIATKRAGAVARETEEELKRSNARAEEAYGKVE